MIRPLLCLYSCCSGLLDLLKKFPCSVNFILISSVLIYSLIGGLLFVKLEHDENVAIAQRLEAKIINCTAHMLADLNYFAPEIKAVSIYKECVNASIVKKKWNIIGSTIFSFASVTTLGFGKLAVETHGGKLFYVLFCLFGMPLGLLLMAKIGKHVEEAVGWLRNKINEWQKDRKKRSKEKKKTKIVCIEDGLPNNHSSDDTEKDRIQYVDGIEENEVKEEMVQEEVEEEEEEEEEEEFEMGGLIIIPILLTYIGAGVAVRTIATGAHIIDGIYSNFLSFTAVDMSGIISTELLLIPVCIIYVFIGLALATVAIGILARYLRRLHYLGRKLEHSGQTRIWFGGKRLTVKELMRGFAIECGVDQAELKKINFDSMIEDLIAEKEGRLVRSEPQPEPEPEPPRKFSVMKQSLTSDINDPESLTVESESEPEPPELEQLDEEPEPEPEDVLPLPQKVSILRAPMLPLIEVDEPDSETVCSDDEPEFDELEDVEPDPEPEPEIVEPVKLPPIITIAEPEEEKPSPSLRPSNTDPTLVVPKSDIRRRSLQGPKAMLLGMGAPPPPKKMSTAAGPEPEPPIEVSPITIYLTPAIGDPEHITVESDLEPELPQFEQLECYPEPEAEHVFPLSQKVSTWRAPLFPVIEVAEPNSDSETSSINSAEPGISISRRGSLIEIDSLGNRRELYCTESDDEEDKHLEDLKPDPEPEPEVVQPLKLPPVITVVEPEKPSSSLRHTDTEPALAVPKNRFQLRRRSLQGPKGLLMGLGEPPAPKKMSTAAGPGKRGPYLVTRQSTLK